MEEIDISKLHLNLTNKTMDFGQKTTEIFDYYMDKFEEMKGLEGARASKSIFFTPFEYQIVKDFCKLNNTTTSELLRFLFWLDGAIPDQLVLAIAAQKKGNIEFAKMKKEDFKFTHLDKYKDWTTEEFENIMDEKGQTRPLRDRFLTVEAVDMHRKKKKFATFAMYAKIALLDFGVFPELAVPVIKSHFRIIDPDLESKMTPQQLKIKRKRQEVNAAKKTKTVKDPKKKVKEVKMNVGTLELEQGFLDKFKKALEDHGIALNTLIRYELIKQGVLTKEHTTVKPKQAELCESFSYQRPVAEHEYSGYKFIKESQYGMPRNVNNLSYSSDARDLFFEKFGRGNFPKWVRRNVFDKYGMYPIASEKSIVDLFVTGEE